METNCTSPLGSAAVVAVIALLIASCGHDRDSASTSTATPTVTSTDNAPTTTATDAPTTAASATTINPAESGLIALDPGPLSSRTSAATVIVDGLLVVYGGASAGVALDDGATYDPATETWEMLPSSNGLAAGATTALARPGAVVFASPDAVAELDLVTGTWAGRAPNPFPHGKLFATATALLSVEDDPTGTLAAAAVLDLDAGTWRDLPAIPSTSVIDVVDLDGTLLAITNPLVDASGRAALTLQGAIWRDLVMPPLDWLFGSVSVTAGPELLIWGGDAPGSPGVQNDHGLAYSSRDGSWREIEPLPAEWWECYATAIVIQDRVLLDVCGTTASYDIAHDRVETTGTLTGDEQTPARFLQIDGTIFRWGERYCYADCEEPLMMLFQRMSS